MSGERLAGPIVNCLLTTKSYTRTLILLKIFLINRLHGRDDGAYFAVAVIFAEEFFYG